MFLSSSYSNSQVIAFTKQLEGKFQAQGTFLNSALVLVFLDPGRYESTTLNHVKNYSHLAWHGLSQHAVHKYSRYLWSVSTTKGWAPSNQCLCSCCTSLTASNSWISVGSFVSAGDSFLEKNAIGCSLFFSPRHYDRTALTPVSDTCTFTVKGFAGSRCFRMEAVMNVCMNLLNVFSTADFQASFFVPFFKRVVMGAAMTQKTWD